MKNKDLQAVQRALDALEDFDGAFYSLSREGSQELMNFLVDEVRKKKGIADIAGIFELQCSLKVFLQKSLKSNDGA
jgi:hypothetical protein